MFTQPLEEPIASTRSILGNVTPDGSSNADRPAAFLGRPV